MLKPIRFVMLVTLLFTACVSTGPLYYSAKNLSADEVEFLFDVDSTVNEMKYFHACIEEMNILPVNNWDNIKKEGVVGLSVLVDTDGILEAAMLIQAVHPVLDSIAMQTVRQATFRPTSQIINVDTSYYLQLLIPYYEESFDLNELAILYDYAYDEEMYDVAPEPVAGWDKAPLRVEYKGYSNMIRVEGKIEITFCIDSKGGVGQFYISKPFGYGAEEQAIEAIRRLQWKPATKAGKPVPCLVAIPFEFNYWY